MQCLLLHPDLYHRDCQHCLRYVYSEEGEDIGRLVYHEQRPVERVSQWPAPCHRDGASCPKGTAENQRVLSARNRAALSFHKRCELLGEWPEDEIVIRNAILIREVQKTCEQALLVQSLAVVTVPR